jgi:peptide/nickel transport system substrate-binding protein
MAASVALFAAACGGGGGGGKSGAPTKIPKDTARPVEGGSLTYAFEMDTLGGFCPPTAQLAASGIEVFQAIYDTLTVPNDNGEYVPYLAKSIAHDGNFTEWTIELRDGITFHNGEPLNADAVKLNFERYRKGILFGLAFADIADVTVTNAKTVKVTTSVPWVAFPAFLWFTGRVGIAAPAQLNDDTTCPTNPIGTGPFKFEEWTPSDHLTVVKNRDYWQKDKFGNQLPYLDQITFRPQTNVVQRVTGLKAGDLDLIQLAEGQQITELRKDAKAGAVKLLESDRAAEVYHTMLNAGKPPFDNQNARLAVAYATDRRALNRLLNNEVSPTWDQPYARETLGYQMHPGFPRYDPKKAEEFVSKYRRVTGQSELHFTLNSTPDPNTQQAVAAIKSQVEKVAGISVDVAPPTEPTQFINLVIAGDYEATPWRNFPGGDPDTLYPWWHSTAKDPNTGQTTRNLVDFGRINDPTIDQALEQGRSEIDPDKRKALYQQIGREFAKQAYNVWTWLALWAFAGNSSVNGFVGPELPGPNAAGDGGSRGLPIASVQPIVGLWISK